MPKRKHPDSNDSNEAVVEKRLLDTKHTLDSDEEDDEPESLKYTLQDEDIEGQEEGGVTLEEGVQFTPFNMREELEEGHFDTDGMYHWKKEKDIRDNWLENIDWVKIKEVDKTAKKQSDSDDDMPEAVDMVATYKKVLSYLQPKETVGKALQRLGGNKSLSASERLKMKKAGISLPKPSTEDSATVTILTELANKILTHAGNMNIYQETYEYITDLVSASSSKKADPVLDMYADDFEDKEKKLLNESTPDTKPKKKDAIPENKDTLWEFKWNLDSTDIQGPHSTEQMEKWSQIGHFGKGVFVRRCGSTQFYSSNRIDFEIYM